MNQQRIAKIAGCILWLQLFVPGAIAQQSGRTERVLISTPKPYDRVISGIRGLGGRVQHQFTYVDGIAADIPSSAMAALRNLVGPNAIEKDEFVPHPVGADMTRGRSIGGKQVGRVESARFKSAKGIPAESMAGFASTHGNAYILNTAGVDLHKLHSQGYTGRGVIVAVIDSGMRPGFPALELGNSVIGGIDFVGDGLGFSNPLNDGHGTFVASMISARAELDLSENPGLLGAISSYAPSALFNGNSIALLGSAPASKIYAVRVFGMNVTAGAPESRIIAAIQHVIDKRKAYDRGQAGGLNIAVCNLSLGNTTLQAGRDLLDKSADALLKAGIVPVISAGNAGPATLTTASPGSSFSAVTVGAASFARNERIMQEVELGEGYGVLWRPFSGTQTAYFSSRGPNADGRPDPDVVASGFANIGQGYFSSSEVSIASGTSFSAPIVAGLAAVLVQAFPNAGAAEIRNAIVASGDRTVLDDGSTSLDQGNGLVNAQNAYELLDGGQVSKNIPTGGNPSHSVRENIEEGTNLEVLGGSVSRTLANLKPGQRRDILYSVPEGIGQITITLSDVVPSLPPESQNALFGDDILLFVHSSKTSSIHEIGDYVASAYTLGGTIVIDDPEPGIFRISVTGDWTNAGKISTDVQISATKEALPMVSKEGRISDSETLVFPFNIPSGVSLAEFRLSWNENWSRYPTNDIDLILVDPAGTEVRDAATLNGPELAIIVNPKPGTWLLVVDGFDLPAGTDRFKLTLMLDHVVVSQQTTISVGASPAGRSFTVDGNTYVTPQTFNWVVGSSHSISTTSPQPGAVGTRYVFNNWSDGGTISHNVITPGSPQTFTANFTTQYQLTTSVLPVGGGAVMPASGAFYNSGQVVVASGAASAGYVFDKWSGASGSSTNPSSVSMTGPMTLTANFKPFVQLVTNLTLKRLPNGTYEATLLLTNNSLAAAQNVVVTSVLLSTSNGTPSPQSLGNIAPNGGSANATVTFAASPGSPGTAVNARYSGSYAGGAFEGSLRVTLP